MLERECGRAWTYAKWRDYMSALNDINMLAKQRGGVRDNATYIVDTVAKNDARDYNNVNEAAKAFRDAEVEDRLYVIRTERLPNSRESASTPGQTMYTGKEGMREYDKYVGDNDEALKRVYVDTLRPEQKRITRLVLADRDELVTKLEVARNNLTHFRQTLVYQRAQAFDQFAKWEALEHHSEPDGIYRQLHDIRRSWTLQTSQDQRGISYSNVRVELSEQLHRGHVPRGSVTVGESRRAIDMAASHWGLMMLDM